MLAHDWEVILSVHNKAPALTEEVTGAELFLDGARVAYSSTLRAA